MAPTRPSIMSEGQTASAPASTWLTAVRASSSTDSSFRTEPSCTTPQSPCEVYSQRQTSVRSRSSGKRGRSARRACCTIPPAIHAPEPSSSFASGIPKRRTEETPRRTSASTSRTRSSTEWRAIPGSCSFGSESGATKSGITNRSSSSRVSRTRSRSGAVSRSRRRRVAGKTAATGDRLVGARPDGLRRSLQLDLDGRLRAGRPVLELDALREEAPDRARGRQQRQRHEHARQPVDLAAREQAEDDEQRVQAQEVPHHVRHDDVPLDLVDEEEEQRHPQRPDRVR